MDNNYIYALPKFMKSARGLRNYLNDRTFSRFKAVKYINEPIIDNKNTNILWGLGKGYSRIGLSNKLIKNEINTIEYFNTVPTLEDYPIVIRTILDGNQGTGIIIAKTEEEYFPYIGSYWSKWIYFQFELGVHVLNGEIKKIFKKICMDDEREFPIRNFCNNYKFSLRSIDNYPKLQEFVTKLYEVIQFEICRYDIGWDSVNKKYICIEANIAPGLTNNFDTLSMYGDYYINKFNLQRR